MPLYIDIQQSNSHMPNVTVNIKCGVSKQDKNMVNKALELKQVRNVAVIYLILLQQRSRMFFLVDISCDGNASSAVAEGTAKLPNSSTGSAGMTYVSLIKSSCPP